MSEPSKIYAGDLLEWTVTLSDYPAPTWSLVYYLLNADGQIQITASADGADHKVSELAATTAAYSPGKYRMTGIVTSGADRHTVLDRFEVEVLADPATLTSGLDQRDHIDKTIEALEATIEGKATHDHLSHSVEGTTIARMSPSEILGWLNHYKHLRMNRTINERRRAGKSGHRRQVKVRF